MKNLDSEYHLGTHVRSSIPLREGEDLVSPEQVRQEYLKVKNSLTQDKFPFHRPHRKSYQPALPTFRGPEEDIRVNGLVVMNSLTREPNGHLTHVVRIIGRSRNDVVTTQSEIMSGVLGGKDSIVPLEELAQLPLSRHKTTMREVLAAMEPAK